MVHFLGSLKLNNSSALGIRASVYPVSTTALMQVPWADTLPRKLNPTRSAKDLDEHSNGFFHQGLMDIEHCNSRPWQRPASRWAMALGPSTCRTFPCPISGLAIGQLGE